MLPPERPDRIRVALADHRLVADAGLILPVTMAHHQGPCGPSHWIFFHPPVHRFVSVPEHHVPIFLAILPLRVFVNVLVEGIGVRFPSAVAGTPR